MTHPAPIDPPPATPAAGDGLFVVRLLPAAASTVLGAPLPCAGQLEHVLSGRRHDFADGAALLACLAHEQRQAAAVAAARPVFRPARQEGPA
jgi:hypothetical protein